MDEIGVYLEYYKSVNMKLRQLNEMISHTIDKVDRLGIINIDDYEKEIGYSKEEEGIRIPLRVIKGVGYAASNAILEERENGEFKD